MNMGGKQYLRDFRRDFKWKEKEELGQKVLKKAEIKASKEKKLGLLDIREDKSEGP